MKLECGTFKLFGRFWGWGVDKWYWISFCTYKADPPEYDDWYSFFGITWTNDPTTNPKGKTGLFIER